MFKKSNVIAFVMLAVMATGSAADSGHHPRFSFTDLDGDADGKLSLEEFSQVGAKRKSPEERFRRLDADNDGYLSEAEFDARRRGKHRRG